MHSMKGMQTAASMHGEYKVPGGKLVVIDLNVRDGRLANVRLSGDFFLEPDSALQTINATLEDQPSDIGEMALTLALHKALGPDVLMYGISPEAVTVAVHRALHEGGTT